MTHIKFMVLTALVGITTTSTAHAEESASGTQVASLERAPSDATRPRFEPADGGTERRAAAFQLSLWDPVQTSHADDSVHGMRLNLPYGVNRQLYGFDFGIASRTTGAVQGAQLGLVGSVEGNFRGLQQGLFYSVTEGQLNGLQLGLYGSSGRLRGLQVGILNDVEGSARGAQVGAINIARGSSTGASVGVVNYSRRVDGVQIGVVNATDDLRGVQIGLANFAGNGFLPFFPVINVTH